MMKVLYSALTFLLLAMAGVLGVAHSRYTPPDIGSLLAKTPSGPSVEFAKSAKTDAVIEEAAKIQLFGLSESELENIGEKLASPEMELVGIFCFGEKKSATILLKNLRIRSVGGKSSGPKWKKRYGLNEQLENGYFVKAIEKDSVVLRKGGDEIVLRLESTDKTSSGRRESTARSTPAPVQVKSPSKKPTEPEKTPAETNGSKDSKQ